MRGTASLAVCFGMETIPSPPPNIGLSRRRLGHTDSTDDPYPGDSRCASARRSPESGLPCKPRPALLADDRKSLEDVGRRHSLRRGGESNFRAEEGQGGGGGGYGSNGGNASDEESVGGRREGVLSFVLAYSGAWVCESVRESVRVRALCMWLSVSASAR